MCNHRIIISFVFTSLIVTGLMAQQSLPYTFRHINQSDGLLHTQVNSIVQDAKGYIWILTPNGLQRYDGTRFVNYPFDLNNPDYIKDSREANLFSDKKNNCLWIISGEIGKLDLRKNKFTLYTGEKMMNDSNFKFNSYTDSVGSTTLLGDFGSYKYNNIDKKILPIFLSASFLAPGKSNFFLTDKENEETWTATWQGLSLFQKKTGKVFTHDYNPIQHPLLKLMDKKKLTGMLKDSRQNFWISTGGPSFYKYSALTKKVSTYSLTDITNTRAIKINDNGEASTVSKTE